MLDQETKKNIDSARQILVGKVPDPKAQVEQITTALIYKFMDDMDQESIDLGGNAKFFTGDYKKYSWHNIIDQKLSGEERLNLYMDAISNISKNPDIPELFRNIFKDSFLPFRDGRTLNLFLKEINAFNYDHSENLGNAFEYLLSILGSQGDAGQFRTPRHIIDFIVEAINPDKNDTILDPACGTAGFLISAYKHILKKYSSNYKKEQEKDEDRIIEGKTAIETVIEERQDYKGDLLTPKDKIKLTKNIVGYDISPDMVKLALVNLYLHQFTEPKITEYDTLTSDNKWDSNFDVILANPPFMTPKGGISPHKKFSIQANRAEVLFVDYIAEHLNINGKAGIIVPEGIIFQNANAYKKLRKNLIENWGLYGVISLPSGVFQPYSGVKTSILLIDKQLAKKSDKILFIKILNDGFDLGAKRGKIDKNDLPKALNIIDNWGQNQMVKEDEKIAFAITKTEIAKNGEYNLTADRYKKIDEYESVKYEMIELGELEKQEKIEFLRGQGISKKDIIKDGKNKCIHYGEIYTLYQPIIKDVISKTNFEGKILSKKGDVLIPATTTADALGIAVARSINEDNVILGGDINIVRTNNKYILSDYLALLISNPPLKIELSTYAKGVNILHLSNKDVRNLKIPLPLLEIQEKIVAEIEAYQKVIDGAKQVIDNWKPNFKIDPEWKMVELGEVFEIESGGTPDSKNNLYWEGNIKWATLVDIPENVSVIYDTKRKITEEGLKNSSAKILPKGTVLVSSRATIGRIAVIDCEMATNQGFKNIIINNKNNSLFVAYILSNKVSQMNLLASGGTFKEISKSSLSTIKIPLPPLEIQEKIVAEIEEEQKIVDSNKDLIDKMQNKIEEEINEVWQKKD